MIAQYTVHGRIDGKPDRLASGQVNGRSMYDVAVLALSQVLEEFQHSAKGADWNEISITIKRG